MDLHTWLDLETGRATTLAESLGVSKTAVSLWRDNGVPMDQMGKVAGLTGDEVTVPEMLQHAFECRQQRKRIAAQA